MAAFVFLILPFTGNSKGILRDAEGNSEKILREISIDKITSA